MSAIKIKGGLSAPREETRNGVCVVGEGAKEGQVLLVTQNLLTKVRDQIVRIAYLMYRSFAERNFEAFGLHVIGGPDVIHAADQRKKKIVRQKLGRQEGILGVEWCRSVTLVHLLKFYSGEQQGAAA